MSQFADGLKSNTTFIVKNNSTNKRVTIFGQPIGPGNSYDLLGAPGVDEAEIKASLLKGVLSRKLKNNEISVISTDLDLSTFNISQLSFLNSKNIGSQGTDYTTQAVWYIDPLNGNDINDGLLSSTAVKTFYEFRRRVGNFAIISRVVDITLLNDLPFTDPLIWSPIITTTGQINFRGTRTQVSTGTFSTVRARAGATNIPLGVTDVSQNWTTQLTRLVVMTSGTNIGAAAWVAKDEGSNIGRLSTLTVYSTTQQFITGTEATPLVTEQYAVYTLTKILSDVGISSANGSNVSEVNQGKIHFIDLDIIPNTTGRSATSNVNGPLRFAWINCIFRGQVSDKNPNTSYINCCFTTSGGHAPGWSNSVNFYGGLFTTAATFTAGRSFLRLGLLFQGIGLTLSGGAVDCQIDDVGFMDWTGAAVIIQSHAKASNFLNRMWGVSAVGGSYPLNIKSGFMEYLTGAVAKFTIVGAAANHFQISGNINGPGFDRTGSPPIFTALRSYTWTLLDTTVAGGGFGGSTIDYQSGQGIHLRGA